MAILVPNLLHRFILFSLLTLMLSLRSGWVYADDNNIADVLIVGAGLSGLSSALLEKSG